MEELPSRIIWLPVWNVVPLLIEITAVGPWVDPFGVGVGVGEGDGLEEGVGVGVGEEAGVGVGDVDGVGDGEVVGDVVGVVVGDVDWPYCAFTVVKLGTGPELAATPVLVGASR